jgi:hypothetical protein
MFHFEDRGAWQQNLPIPDLPEFPNDYQKSGAGFSSEIRSSQLLAKLVEGIARSYRQ